MRAVGLLELTRLVPLLAFVVTLTSVLYVLRYETEEAITNDMVLQFSNGVDGWVPSDDTATVSRAVLMADLLPILQPDHSKQYFVILGEKGVGKSTAVRQTIRQLEGPRGVIYVMAPSASANAFLNRLTTATRYREPVGFFELIRRRATGSTGNVAVSSGLWDVLEKKLLEVGKAYLAKYNRPPVLVIDAADIIYKEDAQLLSRIQGFAKAAADSGCLRVVFVISETSAFEMLQSHSHASRSEVFVVGEIEDNEAVEYLVSKGINKKNATDAVARITGGRFALLNSYVSAHLRGLTNDQVLANYHAATKDALVDAGIKATNPLFLAVSSRQLESSEAKELVEPDKLAQLTRENILTVNPSTRLVAFNSRHIQTFFTETGVLWPTVRQLPLSTCA